MDRSFLEWILQHAMKHSYMSVIKEIYKGCPDIKYEPSLQRFISYVACSKFVLKKRRFDLNHRKMMWYSLKSFANSVPQVPAGVSHHCFLMILILKWIIIVESTISENSGQFTADVIATVTAQNKLFEKIWCTLAGTTPIPCKEVFHDVKTKLANSSPDLAVEFVNLFEKMMSWVLSYLEKCLGKMKSCLPTTAIEEIQCSKINYCFEETRALPSNLWERFNYISARIRMDSREEGLLALAKLLLVESPGSSIRNCENTVQILHHNLSETSAGAEKMVEYYKGRAMHYKKLYVALRSLCQINDKELSKLCDNKKVVSMESRGRNMVTNIVDKRKGGGSLESTKTLKSPCKVQYARGVTLRKSKRDDNDSDGETLVKKFAACEESGDKPRPCRKSDEQDKVVLIEQVNVTNVKKCLFGTDELEIRVEDEEGDKSCVDFEPNLTEYNIVKRNDEGKQMIASKETREAAKVVSSKENAESSRVSKNEGGKMVERNDEGKQMTASKETSEAAKVVSSKENAGNSPVSKNEGGKNSNGRVNLIFEEKEEDYMIGTLPENEFEFPCSIDVSSETTKMGSQEIENVDCSIKLVSIDDLKFSCTPCSSSSESEIEICVENMNAESERAHSTELEKMVDVCGNSESDANQIPGNPEGSYVRTTEVEKHLASGVSQVVGSLRNVVSRIETNSSCNVDPSAVARKLGSQTVGTDDEKTIAGSDDLIFRTKGKYANLESEDDYVFSCSPCSLYSVSETCLNSVSVSESDVADKTVGVQSPRLRIEEDPEQGSESDKVSRMAEKVESTISDWVPGRLKSIIPFVGQGELEVEMGGTSEYEHEGRFNANTLSHSDLYFSCNSQIQSQGSKM